MEVWEAIVLGLIQGLTEFLPVSSSGHLQIFNTLFGLEGRRILPLPWLYTLQQSAVLSLSFDMNWPG